MSAAPSRIVWPVEHDAWDELDAACARASLFTSRPWMAAIEDAYGLRVEATVVADRSGTIEAALPFCRLRDALGDRVRVLPFSDYCDPIGDATLIDRLAAPLLDLDVPVVLRTRHAALAQAVGFQETGRAAWHAVTVPPPGDPTSLQGRGSAPRNARRAEAQGVSVRVVDSVDGLRTFHRMHAHLRKRKYRMLAQPQSFFESLHRHFGRDGSVAVLLAEVAGEPVAGILLLFWNGTAYYKFNASYDTSARPNDLLVQRALAYARERGCHRFDFGLSDLDQPGLLRFKEKFATDQGPISTLAGGARRPPDEAGTTLRRTLGELTELFTDPSVPDDVARRAGDSLYRYFA